MGLSAGQQRSKLPHTRELIFSNIRKLNSEQESIYYGGAEHRPPTISYLQAGPVQCQYEAGYLRYLKAGGRELLRMIYPAVRDHNWGTVAAQISNEIFNIAEDHFEISYECLYKEEEILFWAIQI